MPHIPQVERERIADGKLIPTQPGQLCFLFAQWAVKKYNEKPSWAKIHEVRKALRAPYHHEETHGIIFNKGTGYVKADIETAADLAFFEFYRLVGARHEDVKIEENGDALEDANVPRLPVIPVPEPKAIVEDQPDASA